MLNLMYWSLAACGLLAFQGCNNEKLQDESNSTESMDLHSTECGACKVSYTCQNDQICRGQSSGCLEPTDPCEPMDSTCAEWNQIRSSACHSSCFETFDCCFAACGDSDCVQTCNATLQTCVTACNDTLVAVKDKVAAQATQEAVKRMTAQFGKGKLLRSCDIDRDFCERGQSTQIAPLDRDCESYVGTEFERGDKPDREDCEVGETVTVNFCVLCVERRSKEVISAVEYQSSSECIDDCKRDQQSCLDKANSRCAEARRLKAVSTVHKVVGSNEGVLV